jgi:NADP-dependent 3-hydroxy acid dehydrogenase YdfG
MPAEQMHGVAPVAVITGAGSGIGRATAQALARDGFRLALVDRNRATLAETTDVCGPSSLAIEADLASAEAANGVIEQALSVYGRIDVLHNNAGLMYHHDSIELVDLEEWQTLVAVMLSANFAACRAVFLRCANRAVA